MANNRKEVFKELKGIMSYAQDHAKDALDTLVNVMHDTSCETRDRLSAANGILDRAYGKPFQAGALKIDTEKGETYLDFLDKLHSYDDNDPNEATTIDIDGS